VKLTSLKKLLGQIDTYQCPTIDSLRKKYSGLEAGVADLKTASGEYKADLDACLTMHKELDEMRLEFAKRAEALYRWCEDAQDSMEEVLIIGNVGECDAVDAELVAFKEEFAKKGAELEELKAYQADMVAKGAIENPYARFDVAALEEALAACEEASTERSGRLTGERDRLANIDAQKKQFAAAADTFLEWMKAEKYTLEENTPTASIHPDNAEEIAAGKAKLAYLTEYSAKAGERKTQLEAAQGISDALLLVGEMDNPYTVHSMASLKGMLDMLEKLVRDKVNLIEGQLARAQATITPEQHAELEAAFKHFDKNKNGSLNNLEFGAAMKSLDFGDDTAEAAFAKYSEPAASGEIADATLSFEKFLTVVLQQYKDKDTLDGLLAAFGTLADGKPSITSGELTAALKPAEAGFLQAKMVPADDGNLDYKEWSESVYGNDFDRSLTMAYRNTIDNSKPLETMEPLVE